jgi:hypothetical protein
VPFKDRLMIFAQDLRNEASRLPAGKDRNDIIARALAADNAASIDELVRLPGLQSPK